MQRTLKTLVCGISFSPLQWRLGYLNENHPYIFIGPFTLWCDWPFPWSD